MEKSDMLPTKDLYQQDFQIWLNQTVEQLEKGDFTSLDIEHLIEELLDLGKSERNALVSNLKEYHLKKNIPKIVHL